MKKGILVVGMLAIVTFACGCKVVTEQDLDAEAVRQEERLEESLDNIEEEYSGYVEGVNASYEEVE